MHIHWFDRLPSTNTHLMDWLRREPDLPSGTVVAAHAQTSGRGRWGRVWHSGTGTNLTCSIFLRTHASPVQLPSSAMAAALAAQTLLHDYTLPARVKWPNDVLVNLRKICGILSEATSDHSGIIIGIGLNVNMRAEDASSIEQPATSMFIETNRRFDIPALLAELLVKLEEHIHIWEQSGFEGLRTAWTKACLSLNKEVSVKEGATQRRGILRGFGAQGEMLLETSPGHVESIWSGDVQA